MATTLHQLALRALEDHPSEDIRPIQDIINRLTLIYQFTESPKPITAEDVINEGSRSWNRYETQKRATPTVDWYLSYSENLVGHRLFTEEDKAILDRLVSKYAEYPRDYRDPTMGEMRYETGEYEI